MRRELICNADLLTADEIRRGHMPDRRRYLPLKLFPVFSSLQLWETTKVHTSSAVCLKRDSDVLFDHEEIIVSAADNCNRLQVSVGAAEGVQAGVRHIPGPHTRPSYLCVSQVRNGKTGSVLFQSEEQSSRIRCTCLCRQPFAVVIGQEDGTVQVHNPSASLFCLSLCFN